MTRRVLVVDDDPEARFLARHVLEQAGFEVSEAADVAECFAVLDGSGQPDAIVLDLTMPGASGWDAVKTLRDDPARAHLPIVIVTSHDDDQFRAAAKAAGVQHYITKPYEASELLDAVGRRPRPRRKDGPWS